MAAPEHGDIRFTLSQRRSDLEIDASYEDRAARALITDYARFERALGARAGSTRAMGSILAEVLLRGELGEVFADALRAGPPARLIVSMAKAPDLTGVPWEVLTHEGQYVMGELGVPIFRHLPVSTVRPARPAKDGPLRVLGLVSAPGQSTSLDWDAEYRRLSEALAPLAADGAVTLEFVANATAARVRQSLRREPADVLYYSGQVDLSDLGQPMLVLEDESGRAKAIEGATWLALLSDDAPALVVFDFRPGGASSGDFSPIVRPMLQAGAHAVVIALDLEDRDATTFFGALHGGLASGQAVGIAAGAAQRELFSGRRSTDGLPPALFLADLVSRPVLSRPAGLGGVANAPVSAPPDVELDPPSPSPSGEDRLATVGWRRGNLASLRPELPFNAVTGGAAIVVPESGLLPSFRLPGGASITVLSPDMDALRRVGAEWRRALDKAGLVPPGPAAALGTSSSGPRSASTQAASSPPRSGKFGSDRSVSNGASLAFLVEHDGASCLVTNHAHAARLEQSLRRLLAERALERLAVDVMVLPHNGSAANVTPSLLALVDCERFVVSTDGQRFRHPDPATIELLGQGRSGPVTVYFNYQSATTERYADPEVQRRLNIVAVFPGSDAALSIPIP